eukprot:CCRYP_018517-RA/>CCRYP_018517-RA protein AED:0.45 eAED:0.45 QI:0/0/0/1/0/0/2/0/111
MKASMKQVMEMLKEMMKANGSKGGITVDENSHTTTIPVLQGQCNAQGVLMVPLSQPNKSANHLHLAIIVYKLPSMVEVVRFFHAALVFPMKHTLLTAMRNQNFTHLPRIDS